MEKKINSRFLRKVQAENHNKNSIAYSLSPEHYTWDKKHKKCLGRGFLGVNVVNETIVLCKCCKRIVKKEEKNYGV